MEQITDCTTWDNSNVFTSLEDPKIEESLESISKRSQLLIEPAELIAESLDNLEGKAAKLIPTAQKLILIIIQ